MLLAMFSWHVYVLFVVNVTLLDRFMLVFVSSDEKQRVSSHPAAREKKPIWFVIC